MFLKPDGIFIDGVFLSANSLEWDIQEKHPIKLDDVICTAGKWESCGYRIKHNCQHSEDVFLKCTIRLGQYCCLINKEM